MSVIHKAILYFFLTFENKHIKNRSKPNIAIKISNKIPIAGVGLYVLLGDWLKLGDCVLSTTPDNKYLKKFIFITC